MDRQQTVLLKMSKEKHKTANKIFKIKDAFLINIRRHGLKFWKLKKYLINEECEQNLKKNKIKS